MQDLSKSLDDVAFDFCLARSLMEKDNGQFLRTSLATVQRNNQINQAEIEARVQKRVKEIEDVIQNHLQSKDYVPEGIYIDGVFDLMHVGHYNAIRQANNLGDFLVIGVCSDASVRNLKGSTVMNQNERKEILNHCKFAKNVTAQEDYQVSLDTMDKNSCKYYAHGDDPVVLADGSDGLVDIKAANRLKIFKRTEGISTTEMTRRILTLGEYLRLVEDDPPKASDFFRSIRDQLPSQQFLATSKRILNFSNGIQPKEGDKVIYVQGSFDLLHYGHLKRLQEAKKEGTFLYVGLWDDELTRYYKGSLYPLVKLQERILMTLACKHVDDVIIGAPYVITRDLLTSLNVQKVVRFVNCAEDQVLKEFANVDQYQVPKELGILHDVSIDDEFYSLTTEKLAMRVFENKQQFVEKFTKKNVKEQHYYDKTKEFIVES